MKDGPDAELFESVGLVAIGRNEGERLARCLASVRSVPRRVYVDSGSSDGSVALALKEGVQVVELPVPPNFTAARARNAGLERLLSDNPDLEFVQMVDGDCEVQPEWVRTACNVLRASPELALVFGRRRERYPERSILNALCDDEWNTPLGESPGCGGDALFRISALQQVKFYNPGMIAGEEPELCMRLRKNGWKLRCIDAEMTLHDAALTRFAQWWNRVRRSGHAYGELARLHPDARDPNWPHIVLSIVVWGACLPALLGALVMLAIFVNTYAWFLVAFLPGLWLMQVARLAVRQRRRGLIAAVAAASGFFVMLGKVPQFLGLVTYYRNRWRGKASVLIEYKGPEAT